jgi:hypothetical protein
MILFRRLLVFILVAFSFSLAAQTDSEKALKAEKVAFITSKLQLTSDEAKPFGNLR